MSERPAILFVCLGNICRSPLAEAAFRAESARAGFVVHVDSAGTGGWHIGEAPDRRAQATARRHGIDIGHYRGRQVEVADFNRFTHILALDHDNLEALRRLRPAGTAAELSLLMDHVPGRVGQPVADPYWGDAKEFETTWADVMLGAQGLLRRLISGDP